MSTFRIERIDQGLPDEWILRKNDDGAQIGDDVVAEDVNELSEGIQKTQEELLKSNLYAPGVLLDSDEGIAARLKYLEETAGQASLQDVYENGNIISVQSGRNLLLGGNGEITLDDIGNLTFNPTTMRVKGLGASYLGFTDDSVTTYLSNLNIGANSAGFDLTLTSGQEITFRDSYLLSPISLSEYGETALATVSQTLVGAINELKTGTFSNTLQSIYDQSASGRIVTNATNGPFRVENGSGNPLLSAMNIIGILSVSDAAKVDSLEVGTDSTWDDTNGLVTDTKIKTTNLLESPLLYNNGTLSLQDNRILLTLSELGVSALDTSSQSIAGAINELKTSIDAVGGAASQFGNEHSTVNGMHELITTQAGIGDDLIERVVVRNSSGIKQFSINALGHVIAQKLNLDGVAIEDAIDDLLNHMNGNGEDHSSVLNHLNSTTPHNTVGSLNGLTGNVTVVGASGISVNQSGNGLIISSATNLDLQAVYDEMATGSLVLDTAGGKDIYFRNSSNDILFSIADDYVHVKRDLQLTSTNNKILSQSDINVEATTDLNLESTGGNVNIDSDAGSAVNLDGVAFSDSISQSLDPLLPANVVGAINKVQNEEVIEITNDFPYTITTGMALTRIHLKDTDTATTLIRPIAEYHPMNSHSNFFGQEPNSNIYVALEDIPAGQVGKAAKGGMVTADNIVRSGSSPVTEWIGSQMYLTPQGYCEAIIKDVTQFSNGDNFVLDVGGVAKTFTGNTTASDHANGVFRIFTAGSPAAQAQQTIQDIMDAVNTQSFSQGGTPINMIGLWDGVCPRGKIVVNDNSLVLDGSTLTIQPSILEGGYTTVTLTCETDPATLTNDKFLKGADEYETAHYLANAINRTTYGYEDTEIIREDCFDSSNNITLRDYANYTTLGHGFRAKAIGKSVFIERIMPDYIGNDAIFLSSTAGLVTSNPSGGIAKIRLYNQDRTRTAMTVSSSNTLALEVSDLVHHQLFETEYMEESISKEAEAILFKFQPRTKIADIIDASPTTARFFLNMTSEARCIY